MTLRLILMRHAKSSWKDTTMDDHDRPLNGRGRRSAAALGDWLRQNGFVPDRILCSSATRCQETCAGLALGIPPQVIGALYHASPREMFGQLQRATGTCVLMIGHNEGIGVLAQRLPAEPVPHPKFGAYPTGATLVTEFDAACWRDIRPGTARAIGFVVPRELPGAET